MTETNKTAAKKITKKVDPKVVKTTKKSAKSEVKSAEKLVAKKTTKKVEELVETEVIAEAIVEAEKEIEAEDEKLAKAGKRSSKAIKEAEAKAAKEERKAHKDPEKAEDKPIPKPIHVRTRLERRGKKYRKVSKLIDANKEYTLIDALDLAIKSSPVKFDATVELHVKLGVDPKQADQNVRANLVLPSGTGNKVNVAVFAENDDAEKAKKAGADFVGVEELLTKLDKNTIDFDILIASPNMMSKLGKYARILGPKGLMPSPKSGTVTNDIAKAVKESKAGKVEYRVDSSGIVHIAVGKVSFGTEKLSVNAKAVLASIKASKPASIKSSYLNSIYLTTSMGPSVKVNLNEI